MQSPEIPLPQDKLILMDLDKTLLDVGYNLTDEKVLAEINRVQSLGWQLGLSSDTPLEPLKIWSQRFGLNGPIVAEKGSVLWVPEVGDIVIDESESFFADLKNSFINELIQLRVPFLYGDATQFVRNNPRLLDMVDQRIITINAYRRCSLSFFVRKTNNEGYLEIDNQFGQEMVTHVRNLWSVLGFDLAEDFNHEYGIYILAPRNVSKRSGTIKLMKILSFSRIGMIGDSQGDIIGSDIAIQYAVGNARDELKIVADYISKGEYATGVAEILSAI
ncbi:MAG: HAD hydrolase family protein [Candidatus Daviesbacteria bacterium]